MTDTIQRPQLRRRLSTLLAASLLAASLFASLLVVVSPAAPAEAHTNTGCSAASSHLHSPWWWRARATHLSGSGQTLITWERRYQGTNPWQYNNSYTC